MNEVRIGANVVRCWPELRHICTILPDGSEVPASPNHAEADVALAHELGYGGDTWLLTLGHEVCHTYLAVDWCGQEYSPTLWWVAHPGPMAEDFRYECDGEEAMVLDFQRQLNGVGPAHRDAHLLPGARALIAALMEDA